MLNQEVAFCKLDSQIPVVCGTGTCSVQFSGKLWFQNTVNNFIYIISTI